jgi:hypothetical protein
MMMMMPTTSLTTPYLEEAQQTVAPSSTAETIVTVVPTVMRRANDDDALSYLPVISPKFTVAPESFIELFWQMTSAVSKTFKTWMDDGLAIWVEAFGTVYSVEKNRSSLNRATLISPSSHRSPAFRLRSDDTEASLVAGLIAERRLVSVESSERAAWLSANQWSGLDDLFPLESALQERLASNTATQVESSPPVASSVRDVDVLSLSPVGSTPQQVTSSNILNALHQAYPPPLVISSEEEAVCLEHPISQRGREVKLNINQLVDSYFATEASKKSTEN